MLDCAPGIDYFGQNFWRFTHPTAQRDILVNTGALIQSVVEEPDGSSTITVQYLGLGRDQNPITSTYLIRETPTEVWAQLKAWEGHMQAVLRARQAQRQMDNEMLELPGISRNALLRAHQRRLTPDESPSAEQLEPPAMPAPWDPFAQHAA